MKIIEAMKKIKHLSEKAADLVTKVGHNCVNTSLEKPVYENPKETVTGWIQAHHDIVDEILKLRSAIQRTNIATVVPIEIAGKTVTRTIAEWIHRRHDLAQMELGIWSVLGDRNLKECEIKSSTGGENVKVTIVRHFDPVLRDRKRDEFMSERHLIDAALEVTNAVTELV